MGKAHTCAAHREKKIQQECAKEQATKVALELDEQKTFEGEVTRGFIEYEVTTPAML